MFMCLLHLYLMFICLQQLYLMFMCLWPVSNVHMSAAPVSDVHMSAAPDPGSGVRSIKPTLCRHKFYIPINSVVMIDQSGLPIEGSRIRSQTLSFSSTSSTLASNVSTHKDKRQCKTCLNYYENWKELLTKAYDEM